MAGFSSNLLSPATSTTHEYIRILAPFVIVVILFFSVYYGRSYINRLVRLGEVGYHETKKDNRSVQRKEAEKEADLEYERLLNPDYDENSPVVGKTELYEWSQNKEEIEVYIPLSKYGETISSREVNVSIQPKRLKVVWRREVLVDEEFTASVKVEDSCWMLDNNTSGDPHIWLTLVKVTPTVRNQHWKALFKGGPEVDVGKFGPPVHAIDPNDKNSIRKAVQSFKKQEELD